MTSLAATGVLTLRIALPVLVNWGIVPVLEWGALMVVVWPLRRRINLPRAVDAEALARLDAAEVVRPQSLIFPTLAGPLRTFFARAELTAIGSSDYHALPGIGYARTWVFAKERFEAGVMEALRARRTVVYDRERAYGDSAMIRLAEENGDLPRDLPTLPVPEWERFFSRFAAIAALAGILLFHHDRQA